MTMTISMSMSMMLNLMKIYMLFFQVKLVAYTSGIGNRISI